jgi:prominin 1
MLVVLLCATLGLFYGFCGKRPDGYGDDCCSRATGARFLIL